MWMLDSTYFAFQLSTQTLWLNYLCLFQHYLKHEPSLLLCNCTFQGWHLKGTCKSLSPCVHIVVVTELTHHDKKTKVYFGIFPPKLSRASEKGHAMLNKTFGISKPATGLCLSHQSGSCQKGEGTVRSWSLCALDLALQRQHRHPGWGRTCRDHRLQRQPKTVSSWNRN